MFSVFADFVDVETPTLFRKTPGVCVSLVTLIIALDGNGQLGDTFSW